MWRISSEQYAEAQTKSWYRWAFDSDHVKLRNKCI